jgi:hypothetical protein
MMRFLSAIGICTLVVSTLLTLPHTCRGSSEVEVSDLWDMPITLRDVCNGTETVLFVCDLGLQECREGAVYFDSRAKAIRTRGFRPGCLFVGRPDEIRGYALTLDLDVPVYVDSEARVFREVLEQMIMPVLVLLDGEGNLVRSVYGGGESLDHNLSLILEPEPVTEPRPGPSRGKWLLLALAAAVAAIAVIAID